MRTRRALRASAAALGAAALVLVGHPAVHAATGQLPGGSQIGVSITSPTGVAPNPTVVDLGDPVPITGTASIGQTPPQAPNTLLVYDIDVSGSTDIVTSDPGGRCGDANGDGRSSRILDCEVAALVNLNDQAIARGTIAQVGAVGFAGRLPTQSSTGAGDAVVGDVGPAGGQQALTGPATDAGGAPGPDVEEVLRSSFSAAFGTIPYGFRQFTPLRTTSGNTNYQESVLVASGLANGTAHANRIVVLVSDGEATIGNEGLSSTFTFPGTDGQFRSRDLFKQWVAEQAGSTKFVTFAVGSGATCEPGPGFNRFGSLQAIADATGGTCSHITNPDALPALLPAVVDATLTGLTVTVDGALVPAATSDPLPRTAPDQITWSSVATGLAPGLHDICATASGTDAGGSGSVSECRQVDVRALDLGGTLGGAGEVVEGTPFPVAARLIGGATFGGWSATPDPGTDPGASCAFADPASATTTVTCTDDGSYTLTGTTSSPPDSRSTTLLVTNAAPVVATPSLDPAVVAVGAPVTAASSFTDAGATDTHTCTVDWEDGAGPVAGVVAGGSCSATKAFTAPGVYEVLVTVTDDDGGAGSARSDYLVVYDPNGGFVTGGGSIAVPSGSHRDAAEAAGKGTFGFVSKYQRGASVPSGNTEFQFHAGGLNFKSTDLQWLVVSGAKAQYKGTGTVNGTPGYSFMVTALDGQARNAPAGTADSFRIKITDASGTVFDNQAGASDDFSSATSQPLSSGSIVIHAK